MAMLPPSLKQLDGSGSLNDDSGNCTSSSKVPKKSVRFSTDVPHDHGSQKRSTGCEYDGGQRSLAALLDGQSGKSGGKGSPGVPTAGAHKETAEAAVDAERHGLLPSWRLKMPVVKWCAPASLHRN